MIHQVHSLEFHKTSYLVSQLILYLCCQQGDALGAKWKSPVGAVAESYSIVVYRDLDII